MNNNINNHGQHHPRHDLSDRRKNHQHHHRHHLNDIRHVLPNTNIIITINDNTIIINTIITIIIIIIIIIISHLDLHSFQMVLIGVVPFGQKRPFLPVILFGQSPHS